MEAKNIKGNVGGVATDLPSEIWRNVFLFLPKEDQYNVGIVSEHFQEIIDSIKVEECILKITEENVKEIRTSIENKNDQFSFKRVQIENVTSIDDMKFILQSIGKKIVEISMKNTAVFDILKGNLINVKSLELYFDNVLERSILDKTWNLCLFPFLEKLIFINNKYMDEITQQLVNSLKNSKTPLALKHLKLHCNTNTQEGIMAAFVRQADTLESLHIDYFCQVSNQQQQRWEKVYSRMENLRDVSMSGCGNVFFAKFINTCMNSLQSLELKQCGLTDGGFKEISKLHKLRVLKLSHCTNFTNEQLLNVIAVENHPNMEELHFLNLPKLDAVCLATIVSRFPNLRVLNLESEDLVTNAVLSNIFCFLTHLRILSLKASFQIKDEGFIGFGNKPYSIMRLCHLKELYLDNCRHITDRTLINALILPKLRSLTLGNIHRITSKGIKSLVMNCPSLEFLSISSSGMRDDNSLLFIGNGLKHLRELIISDCDILTENERDHIKDVFNSLQDPITKTTFASKCKLILEN